MGYKILNTIGSKYSLKAKDILEKIGTVDCLDLSQKAFQEEIINYNILVVGLGLNITKKVIDKARNLKIIATATTGLDHIDVDYAQEKNIQIVSLRGETEFLNTIAGTAELACGLMIDLLRQTSQAFDSVKRYEWDREAFRGHNLYGQTLGVVGLGRLGGWMVRYGNAFGMKVLAYDPYIKTSIFDKFACKKVEFEELLERSDIISIHVHLNDETTRMFNAKTIDRMKDTAYLVNTSRGRIVDEEKLLVAIKDKKIAGYATDVLAGELNFNKDFSNHPMVEYARFNKNLIIVPHIGGMTYESREATDIFVAKKIVKILAPLLSA